MAQDPSFDIVSKIEKAELSNAVAQALTEITTRFDFKGSKSDIKVDEENLVISSDNEIKIKQVIDVLINKLAKRGIGLKAFNFDSKIESASGNTARSGRGRTCPKKADESSLGGRRSWCRIGSWKYAGERRHYRATAPPCRCSSMRQSLSSQIS